MREPQDCPRVSTRVTVPNSRPPPGHEVNAVGRGLCLDTCSAYAYRISDSVAVTVTEPRGLLIIQVLGIVVVPGYGTVRIYPRKIRSEGKIRKVNFPQFYHTIG